jgi:tRNA threonylcarbamoyladenosine biosynthesis protein TsaB
VILLAIDSAGAGCSAALWDQASVPDGLLAWRVAVPPPGQAERLIALIEAVLAEAGLGYAALGALAVNHGPGSFTGVRSGVAAARGLALATGLGVLAVSSLKALAAGLQPGRGEVLAALDARRGEVYAQRFGSDLLPLDAPCAITPEQAAALVSRSGRIRLVGSGAPLVQPHLSAGVSSVIETVPADARMVARCAARRLLAGEQPVAGTAVRPLYLRAPDARPAVPLVARRAAAAP